MSAIRNRKNPAEEAMIGVIVAQEQQESVLFPLATRVSRHLLAVYDKPLIYYPISTLMLAGIRQIIITGSRANVAQIHASLKNGAAWGIQLSYQAIPPGSGLAGALIACQDDARAEPMAIISGETIFHGKDLVDLLKEYASLAEGAGVFASNARNPGVYPNIELNTVDNPIRLEDAPAVETSAYAVPNLYFFDHKAPGYLTNLQTSQSDEPTLSALCRIYMQTGKLRATILGRGIAWLDVQTPEALLQASNFIQVIQDRQGVMIACPEEIAYRQGYITHQDLHRLATHSGQGAYCQYLLRLLNDEPLNPPAWQKP